MCDVVSRHGSTHEGHKGIALVLLSAALVALLLGARVGGAADGAHAWIVVHYCSYGAFCMLERVAVEGLKGVIASPGLYLQCCVE